jgi:methionine-rich copper-binding protein CopC
MTIRSTLATSLVITFGVAVAVLLNAAPVFAHARYKSSTPGTGEVLTASPARVDITFTEQIQKVSGTYGIEVTRDRGAAVTSGPAIVDDADRTHLSVPLQAGLGPGRYVVNWKNTSDADGDPVTGAFSFYISTQPNAVDLENDRQLAQIGFEDVTATAAAGGATASPATSAITPIATLPPSTAAATRPPGTSSPGISAATPIPTTTAATQDGGGSSSRVWVVGVIVAVVLVAGFAAWQYLSRRRR